VLSGVQRPARYTHWQDPIGALCQLYYCHNLIETAVCNDICYARVSLAGAGQLSAEKLAPIASQIAPVITFDT
jgi:hypothetical protein